MSEERDILKSLLLKEELKLLDQIKQKVLSEEQFTQEVSKVLGGAIKRAQKEDKSFERALSTPIQKGVTRAFSDNKQSIIDGLLPIMGQLIRKTVANSIKQFVADINRTLELGFSSKALKWRWQAFKTDQSFAEIVFQKTIRYQVNEIFLINQENGLLIEHVGTDDMLKDNNAISAMLSVIREFIGDSLQSPDDNLQSAEMGDNLLFFSHGPKAFLVFVVKGSPTERFKIKAQQLIENVHAEFSDVLINEENYRNNTDLQKFLRDQLVTKSISDKPKKINWVPWVVGILTIVLALSYWSYKRNKEYDEMVDIANSIGGLYVQSMVRTRGKFKIKGLVDPLADTSSLQREDVILDTRPYISLDDTITKKRVEMITADFNEVNFNVVNQELTVRGSILPKEQKKFIQKLNSIVGIKRIKNKVVVDNSTEITAFFESFFAIDKPPEFTVSHNHISLSGTLTYSQYQNFIQEIKHLFPEINVNGKTLTISDSNQLLINSINSTVINIPLLQKKAPKQIRLLTDIIKINQQLEQRGVSFKLSIIGQSDCYGTLSDSYSMKRAETIMSTLIQSSIDPAVVSKEILTCNTFDQTQNDAKRVVSFLIKQTEKNNESR